ncbi:hypothetical protein ACIBH1_06115 [Nonomuraea sp. NPDC050663]|uniref:acyl-CoA-like ligand-binding transcription factor n=1 Tax=Nonomuraea sp. NPDC050663 TaxID=3364370 RepID=UPI0037BB6086
MLYPESDGRIVAVLEAIATRGADDGPADVLLRALREVNRDSDDMVGRTAALRMRLIRTVPAVRGRGLQLQLDAKREIARHLHAAFPGELDEVGAAALVGAFVGAVTGALQVLLEEAGDDLDTMRRRMSEATDAALGPWMRDRQS